MPQNGKLIFGSLLLLTAAGGFLHHGVNVHAEKLARPAAEFAHLEATVRRARQQFERTEADRHAIEREIVAARLAAADAEARSTMRLWANRIALLRKILEEMPGQSLPELRLL